MTLAGIRIKADFGIGVYDVEILNGLKVMAEASYGLHRVAMSAVRSIASLEGN